MDEKTLNYVIETFKGVYNMGTSFIVGDIVSIYDLKNNNFVLPIEKYIKKLEEKKESE
jgi:hypothetical protein